MLSLLCFWLLLSGITLVWGTAAQCVFRVESRGRDGDVLLRSFWTGLLMLGWFLLTWSLFLPITPWTGAVVVLMCVGGLTAWRALRETCARLLVTGIREGGGYAGILAVAAAWAVVQPMTNRDALEYHLDLVQIFSRTGLVPGLGLIHDRFGFVSSWFTLPALFNHGPFSGRTAVTANGYVFFLMLSHACMSASRLTRGRASTADVFVATAFTVGTLFPVYLNFPVGSTADFAVLLYILAAAWTALTVYPVRGGPPRGFRDPRLLPVFMGALLFSVKLSAIPVPAAMGILYVISRRLHPRAWLTAGSFVILLLPWIAASVWVTGFLVYPGPWNVDLPWTLGHHLALDITHWGQPGPLGAPSLSLDWLRNWLSLDVTHVIGFSYFLFGLVVTAWILLRHRGRIVEFAPILLSGFLGVIFMVLKAPSVRFGWGYLVILPCILPALYTQVLNTRFRRMNIRVPLGRSFCLAGCLVIVFGISLPVFTGSERRVREAVREGRLTLDPCNRLLRPPVPPRIRYDDQADTASPDTRHVHDPRAYLDGPRAMTYPLIPSPGVRFRNPEIGPRGGFEHE